MEKIAIQILLIEDNPADVLLLQEALALDPLYAYQVTPAERLSQGLLHLQSQHFDILLLDLNLPDSQGLETLSRVRAQAPDVPVVVLSGLVNEQIAIQAMQDGAQDYLVKGRAGWESLSRVIRYAVERQQNQAELHAVAQRYRALIENSADAVALVGVDGTLLYESPATTRILGYPPETLNPGDRVYRYIHPADQVMIQGLLEQLAKQPHGLVSTQFRLKHTDTTWRWAEATATNLLDEPGVRAFVINYRDITERKLGEERLRESERFNQATIDALAAHLCVLDETGVILKVNQSWRDFAKANPPAPENDCIGMNYLAVCDSASGPSSAGAGAFAAGLRAVMQGQNEQYELEYPCHAPAEERWFIGRITRFSGAGPARIVITHENITRRKVAEQAIVESEAKLRVSEAYLRERVRLQDQLARIAATVPGMIWSFQMRPDGTFCMPYTSPAIEDLFGLSLEDVREDASALFALMHPADLEHVQAAIAESAKRLILWQDQYRVRHPSKGEVWIEGQAVPMREPDGSILWHGFVQDVTERKRGEIERQTLLQIMQALAVTEDLPAFLEVVHHAVARVIAAQNFFIILYNKSSELFEEVYGVDQYDPLYPPFKLNKSISAFVFRTGQPLLLDPDLFDQYLSQGLIDLIGTRPSSWLGVPLKTSGETIGVMVVQDYADSGRYSARDKDFLVSIAGQVALAVERKRAEEDRRRSNTRTEALAFISQLFAASATNYAAQPEVLARQVAELVGDGCLIRLVAEDEQVYTQAAQYASDPALAAFFSDLLAIFPQTASQGIAGWITRTGQPLLFSSLDLPMGRTLPVGRLADLDPSIAVPLQAMLDRFGPVDLAAFILRAQGQFLGILITARRSTGQPYTASDAQFLQNIADRAALAITNARLLAQVRRQNSELEQRVLERTAELRRSNAELEHAARAKDEFMASMSHELRTPLNAILTFSESLEEGIYGPLNEKQIKPLRLVTESGQHLLTLINDLLDLSKIQAGKLELEFNRVELEPLCQASLRLVRQQAQKKRLTVSFVLDQDLTHVNADARSLKQMLVNLLSNAVKFTPEGGKIGLEVVGDIEKGAVHFTVWDTGIGIAPEHMQRLFQPFMQIDSRLARLYGGTGLGLALVYRMAELHGGSVALVSEPGQGSRFTISLPWNELGRRAGTGTLNPANLPEVAPPAAPGAGPARARQPLLLLAEDNPANQLTFSDYLTAKGYQVLLAADGEQTLLRAKEARPDLILMDIQMPVLDGLQAIRRLRADPNLSQVPILALTALAMPGDRERCLAAGASDYLPKPLSLKYLLSVIAGYLE